MIYRAEKVKWLDKKDIESTTNKIIKITCPNRKPFTPINTEQVIIYIQNRYDKKLQLWTGKISEGLDGKYELSENGYRIITINENLYNNPTESLEHIIAHEFGHYWYHTTYLKQIMQQKNILGAAFPSTSNRKLFSNYSDAEWQADYFSGALRLPSDEVYAKHSSMFDNLGILGKFQNNSALYRYIGEDATHTTLEHWAKEFGVTPFCLSVRMFYIGILDAGGRSFISYDRKSRKVIEGFAY